MLRYTSLTKVEDVKQLCEILVKDKTQMSAAPETS